MNWLNRKAFLEKVLRTDKMKIYGRDVEIKTECNTYESNDETTRVSARIILKIETPQEHYSAQSIILYSIPTMIVTTNKKAKDKYSETYKIFDTVEEAEKEILRYVDTLQ